MDDNVTWTVANQRQTTAQDNTGRYVPVVEVTYVTANGLARTVKVTEATYSVDAVREAIEADLATAQAVAELHG